jgi:hypothetical protein
MLGVTLLAFAFKVNCLPTSVRGDLTADDVFDTIVVLHRLSASARNSIDLNFSKELLISAMWGTAPEFAIADPRKVSLDQSG